MRNRDYEVKQYFLEIDFSEYENRKNVVKKMIYSENDINTAFINAQLKNNGRIINLSNYDVIASIWKSTGNKVNTPCDIVNAENGEIEVPLTREALKNAGVNPFTISIVNGERSLESPRFYYRVEEAIVSDDDIENADEFGVLVLLISQVKEVLKDNDILVTRVENLESLIEEQEEIRNTHEITREENESTRQTNEEERKTNELTRQTNEEGRKVSEIARKESEEIRNTHEITREENESTRQINEEERKTNELTRQTNEEGRKVSEIARKESEEIRNTHEITREENESTRQINEEERKTNELTRQTNEEGRKVSEIARKESEEIRNTHEITREENESTRQTNEEERKANELTRQTNEEERKVSEITRKENEEIRNTHEITREENESTRQTNEEERKTNELTRQKSISNMQKKIDDKVDEADNKIVEVNTAKTDMTTTVSNKITEFEKRFNELENLDTAGEILQSKETTDGQIKDTLKERLTYDFNKLDLKIEQLIAGGINVAFNKLYDTSEWIEVDGGFELSVEHNLVTQKILVSSIDKLNRKSLITSYKIMDDNNIVLFNEVAIDIEVTVVNGGSAIELIKFTINDDIESLESSYSSIETKRLLDKKANLEHTHDIYVEKIEGKELSTEDYTTEEKVKLSQLDTYKNKEIKFNTNGSIIEILDNNIKYITKFNTNGSISKEKYINDILINTTITNFKNGMIEETVTNEGVI
ncbi:BppU family phage baseplate upper protein [Clostridioides difficile]|uniref:BppU family phage baseplate upper protein n=1 Tax=Clostridioides difficile TaxID=1496 RepID=UPI003BAD9698